MAEFIISTYEQEGTSVRICCLLISAKDSMTSDDVLEAIKKASTDYCTTPEGRRTYENNCNCFNYGDFDVYVPNDICEKYGISKIGARYNYIEPLCFDEQLVNIAADE